MNHFTPTRLLSVAQVLDRRGGSRSSLYDELNPRSQRFDPGAPKPIKYGRRTYFVEEEVETWLRRKIEQFRARPPPD